MAIDSIGHQFCTGRGRSWLAAIFIASALAGASGQVRFDVLPSADGARNIMARGVSGNGQVVFGSSGRTVDELPYAWRREGSDWVRSPLPTEGVPFGRALATSFDGDVIVGMTNNYVSGATYGTPAIWSGVLGGSPTVQTPLDDAGPDQRRGAYGGVSSDGLSVAGTARRLSGPLPRAGELWTWESGTSERVSPPDDLDYISSVWAGNAMSADGQVIVGSRHNPQTDVRTAFRHDQVNGLTDLSLPQNFTYALADVVSRDGSVVGGIATLTSASDTGVNPSGIPVLWKGSNRVELPLLGGAAGPFGRVFALSGDGSIAGGVEFFEPLMSTEEPGVSRHTAVVWIDDQVVRFSEYVTSRGGDLQGVTPNWITGISDDGNVFAGFGTQSGRLVSFVFTVPGAGTVAILGVFTASLGGRRR